MYTIKLASKEEGIKVQSFIDKHWKKGHALVKSTDLFNFQHYDKESNNFNYFLAEREGEIDAIIGFIPTRQYDQGLTLEGDYWGAIWKKREDINNTDINDVGLSLFLKLFKLPYFHSFSAIGVSDIALKFYKAFKCKVGCLSQYYIINDKYKDFKIAGNVTLDSIGADNYYVSEPDWNISEIDLKELYNIDVKAVYRPHKSIEYLINRYSKHPIYKYHFYGVYRGLDILTILVARIVEVNDSKVIRIVDVLGRLQGSLYGPFQALLQINNAEYIDFMNYGIDEKVFYSMGFRKLDLEGKLIIPNYFEPFEQMNVKIDIAWKADYEGYVAFKGDSDQDRPNIL